ncbi:MAG: hypothetical protein HKN40_10835 [Winogradskyella sp.]|uniref:hypothetical protein n=1 Tax=Winogradskyella sp. TaxID=1883156 RepID=UPI0017A62E3D|nr:hypothetical protein [Winogradskyella sp.]
MRVFYFSFVLIFGLLSFSQAPNNGYYIDSVQESVFEIPNTTNINEATINSRTYELNFNASSVVARQFILMEADGDRGIMCYVENGFLIVGAYNIETNDYTNIWPGTYFRKLINANTWYHLALVFDNMGIPTSATGATDNTNFKWYLDGVLQDEKAGYQIGGSSNHKELVLGYKSDAQYLPASTAIWTPSGQSQYTFGNQENDGGGNEYYFDGYVWGFRVWDDVRSQTEINDNKFKLIMTVNTDDLILALDGDTMTYLRDDVISNVDNLNASNALEWEGTVDTDWSNTLNWKNGLVPDNDKQEPVLISRQANFYPVITSNVTVGDLELELHNSEPGSITIADGGVLDIAYDLLHEGEITIQNNGGLRIREGEPVQGAGFTEFLRDTPNYPVNYFSIWSTPFAEADSQFGSIFTNSVDIYEYDASQDPGVYVLLPSSDLMSVGSGYFIRSKDFSGVLTRSFTGALNNGNVFKQVFYQSATQNHNLLGNPYSCAIDWLRFYEYNSDVLEGTMYFWDQSTVGVDNSVDDYKSYNYGTGPSEPGVSQYIAPGQGVFVNTSQAGNVVFNNSQRVVGENDNFYRPSVNQYDGRSWLRLGGANGYSSLLIGFVQGATHGYEAEFDSRIFLENPVLDLYTIQNSIKLEIDGRPVLQEDDNIAIPLGFTTSEPGNYEIAIVEEYIPVTHDIILEDTQENTFTDLRINNYNFSLDNAPVENNTRFIIHYLSSNVLDVDENALSDKDITFSLRDGVLETFIASNETPVTVEVFDFNGKNIIQAPYKDHVFIPNLAEGFYIVKYNFNTEPSIVKKTIHY